MTPPANLSVHSQPGFRHTVERGRRGVRRTLHPVGQVGTSRPEPGSGRAHLPIHRRKSEIESPQGGGHAAEPVRSGTGPQAGGSGSRVVEGVHALLFGQGLVGIVRRHLMVFEGRIVFDIPVHGALLLLQDPGYP